MQKDGTIEIYFAFPDYITLYERYPDTIISGLARIGGLFAALRVSLILLFANSCLYKRKLKRMQPSADDYDADDIEKKCFDPFKKDTIEEKYSIENFDKLLHNVTKHERTI